MGGSLAVRGRSPDVLIPCRLMTSTRDGCCKGFSIYNRTCLLCPTHARTHPTPPKFSIGNTAYDTTYLGRYLGRYICVHYKQLIANINSLSMPTRKPWVLAAALLDCHVELTAQPAPP